MCLTYPDWRQCPLAAQSVTTSRRDFLRKTSLALAGGLVLGDAVMDAYARLTHVRTSFPSAEIGRDFSDWRNVVKVQPMTLAEIAKQRDDFHYFIARNFGKSNAILRDMRWKESKSYLPFSAV